jgi:2-polyprenyl-3-methyl-5-hydroxy-6-metoxy-1,4-benzoquinol methylase
VISTETLEHLVKEDGGKFLENCISVTKPDGMMILTSPNPNLKRENEWHLYEWPEIELSKFIADHGWTVVDKFDMKCPTREIRKVINVPQCRIPNELMRGAFVGLVPGSVMIYVLQP